MNVGLIGTAWAATDPDREAVVDLRVGVRLSFGQVHARADKVASWLRQMRFGPGDWAIFASRNRHEFFELFLGVAKTGGALYPINWRLSDAELASVLESVNSRVIFCDADMAGRIDSTVGSDKKVVVFSDQPVSPVDDSSFTGAGGMGEVRFDYAEVLRATGPSVASAGGDTAVLAVHTGGTTGRVKGAIHTHSSVLAAFMNNSAVEAIVPTDRYLVMGQLFHSAAILALNYFMHGAAVVLFDYSPQNVVDVIDAERVTATLAFPSMVRGILPLGGANQALGRLRSIQYGGGGFALGDIRAMVDINPGVLHCYGTSESVGVTFLTPAEHREALATGDTELLRSCGREAVLAQVRLVDEAGDVIDSRSRAIGELQVRSGANLRAYIGLDTLYGANAWVPTGDLGSRRVDGRLLIVGRSKEVVRCGGENIYPRSLEEAIRSLPNVADVAVVGVADDRWGEVPVAFVVGGAGLSLPSASAVIDAVRDALGSYQKPHRVFFRDSLPVSPAGKVELGALRQQAELLYRSTAPSGESGDSRPTAATSTG
jgi:acyl-CoA synthetase (AMP-forming)/AMP-acid ligase II